jgi:peptide chain release factor 1
MFDRLEAYVNRYNEVERQLSDMNVVSDIKKLQELGKERAQITPIIEKYKKYKELIKQIEDNEEILKSDDRELIDLVKEEQPQLKQQREKYEAELKILLLPTDPMDEKNVVLEIRAGTGGEEAGLFAADLFRMYSRYAEKKGWKVEIMSMNDTGLGAIKEVIALIKGERVYSQLKYESGTHRVQRVPKTEASGRVHTSAATVAVLPEAEEIDIQINPGDLKIDICRAGGAGGQHVNTTDSAIRLLHIPTGITVSCQDERSQHKNKAKAMTILRARLFEKFQTEANQARASERKSQIGTGDRSERIRTYNFPQGRLTDHRIGLTLYQLDKIIEGDVEELVEALVAYYQAEALKAQ